MKSHTTFRGLLDFEAHQKEAKMTRIAKTYKKIYNHIMACSCESGPHFTCAVTRSPCHRQVLSSEEKEESHSTSFPMTLRKCAKVIRHLL